MNKKLSYEEVCEFLQGMNYELLSEEYKSNRQKLLFKDQDGYYYTSQLSNLKMDRLPEKFGIANPYTIQNIKLWCKLNNKSFELLSNTYKKSSEILKWKCLVCGEVFKSSWNNISRGNECGYCTGKQVGLSNCLATRNPELTKEWHPTLNGNLTPYDVTEFSNKYIWWQCSKNTKHIWHTTISNRKNKGCPFCTDKKGNRRASEDYNLLVVNPELCKEWDYTKNKKKPEEYTPVSGKSVWWICSECNNEWKATISSRNSGYYCGCPECAESHGEKRCKEILTQYNLFYKPQYSFNDLVGLGNKLLRFDFAVFWDKEETKLRLLIEYDGIFHYEKQYDDDNFETIKEHDKRKNDYCILNNIFLIRIPYWDFENIESILDDILNKNNVDSKYKLII